LGQKMKPWVKRKALYQNMRYLPLKITVTLCVAVIFCRYGERLCPLTQGYEIDERGSLGLGGSRCLRQVKGTLQLRSGQKLGGSA